MRGRLALVLFGAAIGIAGLWAGQVTIGDQPAAASPDSLLAYTVAEDTVERSMPVIVVAERTRDLVAVNLLSGVVTRVPVLDGAAETGTVVYEVAGVPVQIVEGAVPFYRDLAPGVAGEDVAQLQSALVALGHLQIEPDGQYGASTAAAVREWRRDAGRAAGDRMPLGELIAVTGLPRLVSVADEISVGRIATAGSDALFVLSREPSFELPLSEAQAQAIDPAATLVIEHQGMEWQAAITTSRSNPEQGQVVLGLAGLDGGPVCGQECDTLPAEGSAQLRGRLVSVPATTGPAVPVAALETHANGMVSVRLESGSLRPVEVVATAGGLAIVEGLDVGERVLVGGQPDGGEND